MNMTKFETYFILSEDISHVLSFYLSNLVFFILICVRLSNWIVKHLLALDKGIGYFLVRFWNTLEIRLFVDVIIHFIPPVTITVREACILCSFSCVHFR